MSTLDVPGAHLHYETLGNGPLLLLIPGAPGVGGIFASLAARLSDRYTVVTYDRRGPRAGRVPRALLPRV